MVLKDFFKEYPDEETCLRQIMTIRYGFKPFCDKCQRRRSFNKMKGRPVYQCGGGHQVSPLAGTIFEKTTTKLQLWFYTMFTMTKTRSGISAKTLQREIGVTYKTAWRMMKQIRIAMGKDSDGILKGIVEVDEAYFGGRGKNKGHQWRLEKPKEIVMGMVAREGRAKLKHIPDTSKYTLVTEIEKTIDPKATIMTDENGGYRTLYKNGYLHYSVNHKAKEYVRDKIYHTNSIEGLWGRIKPGIKGVYRKVSPKYIESYMDEYVFRYNNRKEPGNMFTILLESI